MNSFIRTFVYSLFLLPLLVTHGYAADAPDIDQSVVSMEDTIADQYNMSVSSNTASQNNFYIGISNNIFSGNATQDDLVSNWAGYFDTDQPKWSDTDASFGFTLGKYFNASSDIRHALEINYIDEFQAKFDLNPTQNRNLINNYYNVVSFDYNYLKKLTDNIEFIGSGGIGTMTMDGAQADIGQPATGDNATFDSEDSIFMSFGAGLLINLDDDYDLKLLLKRYSDTETGLLTNNANRTDRHFGFEDSYISSISLLYNF